MPPTAPCRLILRRSARARAARSEALLTGRRGLRADVNIPSLDPTGPSYEPAVLARFALDLLQTFSVVPSDGELLLLLPGALICAEAQRLLDGADFVPAELRASGRVRISSWALEAPPAEGAEDLAPAAVLIVGLAPSENSDDDSLVRARGWLRLAQTASTAVLSLNARLGASVPAELDGWEAVYSLASYVVSRVDGGAAGAGGSAEARAVLWRAFPGAWRVWLDGSGSGRSYEEVASLDGEPDEGEILDALRPSIELAAAAADAAAVADAAGGAAAPPPPAAQSAEAAQMAARLEALLGIGGADADAAGADADDAGDRRRRRCRCRRCRRRGGRRGRRCGGGVRALAWDEISASDGEMKLYTRAPCPRPRARRRRLLRRRSRRPPPAAQRRHGRPRKARRTRRRRAPRRWRRRRRRAARAGGARR